VEWNFDDSINDTKVPRKVQDTLFNVHRYQLQKSEAFANLFKAQEGASQLEVPEEGSSPENPIAMLGIEPFDFEALLTMLYAP
jgi:hypothetical protein